jgi:hypothetical protein
VKQYRIAGRQVATDSAPLELAPFEIGSADAELAPAVPCRSRLGSREGELVFDGDGLVVDRLRRVVCRVDRDAYWMEIGGIGSYWVALDGTSLDCFGHVAGASSRLAQLALLGPALTVALALQGVFCLHASAVEVGSRILALAGESGSGKSTLACRLDGLSATDWQRAGDDILPFELASGTPIVHTDFPQLKLTSAEQPWARGQSCLPLVGVFLLDSSPVDRAEAEVRVEPLSALDSVLALVRHTVAARLFGTDLLKRHLQICAAIVDQVKVHGLSYPWQPGATRRVAAAIASRLE